MSVLSLTDLPPQVKPPELVPERRAQERGTHPASRMVLDRRWNTRVSWPWCLRPWPARIQTKKRTIGKRLPRRGPDESFEKPRRTDVNWHRAGVSFVLDLKIPTSRRAEACQQRGSRPDLSNGSRESDLGSPEVRRAVGVWLATPSEQSPLVVSPETLVANASKADVLHRKKQPEENF